jgi:hypothetical protein
LKIEEKNDRQTGYKGTWYQQREANK